VNVTKNGRAMFFQSVKLVSVLPVKKEIDSIFSFRRKNKLVDENDIFFPLKKN